MQYKLFHMRISMALCAALLLGTLSACGVTGMPKPRNPQENFSIINANAIVAGACMAIQGQVKGVVTNVDRIDVELAPIRGPEDCPGCPFNALESSTFTPETASLNADTGLFTLTYCPTIAADAHRWRLVARNIHTGLPYVLTVPKVVVLSGEK